MVNMSKDLNQPSNQVTSALQFIHSYAPNIDEWILLKKELLKTLPVEIRKKFSTRDPKTKKHSINQFEQSIIDEWNKLTEKLIVFNIDEYQK